jgi:hypothetical protein
VGETGWEETGSAGLDDGSSDEEFEDEADGSGESLSLSLVTHVAPMTSLEAILKPFPGRMNPLIAAESFLVRDSVSRVLQDPSPIITITISIRVMRIAISSKPNRPKFIGFGSVG